MTSAWSASVVMSNYSKFHAFYGAKAYFDTGKDGRMNKEPIEIVSDIFPLWLRMNNIKY